MGWKGFAVPLLLIRIVKVVVMARRAMAKVTKTMKKMMAKVAKNKMAAQPKTKKNTAGSGAG